MGIKYDPRNTRINAKTRRCADLSGVTLREYNTAVLSPQNQITHLKEESHENNLKAGPRPLDCHLCFIGGRYHVFRRSRLASPTVNRNLPNASGRALWRDGRMVHSQCPGKLCSRGALADKNDDMPIPLWLRRDILRNSETLSAGSPLHRLAQRISRDTRSAEAAGALATGPQLHSNLS